jgi:hypothetical protein
MLQLAGGASDIALRTFLDMGEVDQRNGQKKGHDKSQAKGPDISFPHIVEAIIAQQLLPVSIYFSPAGRHDG